ncbi:MAG: hypothetical protein WBX15_04510, partial [Thermoanaerobaculia bacterium]
MTRNVFLPGLLTLFLLGGCQGNETPEQSETTPPATETTQTIVTQTTATQLPGDMTTAPVTATTETVRTETAPAAQPVVTPKPVT